MNNNYLLKILLYIFVFSIFLFLFRMIGILFTVVRIAFVFVFKFWYIFLPLFLIYYFWKINKRNLKNKHTEDEKYKDDKTIDISDYKIE